MWKFFSIILLLVCLHWDKVETVKLNQDFAAVKYLTVFSAAHGKNDGRTYLCSKPEEQENVFKSCRSLDNERTFPASKSECDCENCLKKIKLFCGKDGLWYPERSKVCDKVRGCGICSLKSMPSEVYCSKNLWGGYTDEIRYCKCFHSCKPITIKCSKRGRTGGRWNPMMSMTFSHCNLRKDIEYDAKYHQYITYEPGTVTYTCDLGYKLDGESSYPCINGTTAIKPRCVLEPTTTPTTIPTTKQTTLIPTTKTTPIPTTKRTTVLLTTKTTTISTTQRPTKTTPVPTTTTILTTLKRISTTPFKTIPTTTSTTKLTTTSKPSTEPTTVEVTSSTVQEAIEPCLDILPTPLQSIFKQIDSETTSKVESTVSYTTKEKLEPTSMHEESTTEKMQESSIPIAETNTTSRPHFDDDKIESSSSTSTLDLAANETNNLPNVTSSVRDEITVPETLPETPVCDEITVPETSPETSVRDEITVPETSVTSTIVTDKYTETSTVSSEIHDISNVTETTPKTFTETTEVPFSETTKISTTATDLAHSSEITEIYTTEKSSFNYSQQPNDTETTNIPEISTITTTIHGIPNISEVPETTTIQKRIETSTVNVKIPIVTETYEDIPELIVTTTHKKLDISTEVPETVTDITEETEEPPETNFILYYALLIASFIIILCLIIAVCIVRLKQRKSIDVSHLHEPEIYPLKGSPSNLSFTNKLSELDEIQLKCMTDDDKESFHFIKIPEIRKSIS